MSKVQVTAANELVSTIETSVPAPRRQVKPLVESKIGLLEHKSQRFVITLAAGQSIEDILSSAYWSAVAGKFRRGDRIDVHTADSSWFAELYVRNIADGAVKAAQVALLRHVKFDDAVAAQDRPPATHEAKWLGPNAGWGVSNIANGKVAIENLPDREAAEQFLRNLRV